MGWGDHERAAAQWMREAQRLSLAWSEAGRRTERLQAQLAVADALGQERQALRVGGAAGSASSAGGGGIGRRPAWDPGRAAAASGTVPWT